MRKQTQRIFHADRVFSYLKEQNRPLSAYAIFEGLRMDGLTASKTIHHALKKLLTARKMRQLESLKLWMVCAEEQGAGTLPFATCHEFGNITKHDVSRFPRSIANLSKGIGSTPKHIVFEIHDRCSSCNTGVPAH